MKRLLRYGTRHHLWVPRGYKGCFFPQLNPLEWTSHGRNNKKTWSFHEPIWLWRLRLRLFAYGGAHRCPERGTQLYVGKLPDRWDIGCDGMRTCSCCGSLHPDDLMKVCRKVLIDARYRIEGTTKSYKLYIRQPGVRNAAEGAIKFYMWHVSLTPTVEDQELFAEAVKVSSEHFKRELASMRAAR